MNEDPPHREFYVVTVLDAAGSLVFEDRTMCELSPREAAARVVRYYWPVAVGEGKATRRAALAQVADHRIVVKSSGLSASKDKGAWSVGSLLLEQVDAMVRERQEERVRLAGAQEALRKARDAVKAARGGISLAEWYIDEAARDAIAAGVDPAEVEKVKRQRALRQRKTKSVRPNS